MKKSKKIILQTATFLAAISLCVGLTTAYTPVAKASADTISVSAQVRSGEQELADKKDQAKSELATYFNAMNESDYDAMEWAEISRIQNEGNVLIDEAVAVSDVDEIVAGVKYAADGVLMKSEKAAFATYVSNATANVQNAFVESLYRDAERAEGKALVQEAKTALANAKTYAEAEAVELSYLAKIDALKTAAEWEAEESANEEESDFNKPTVDNTPEEETENGCSSSIHSIWAIFSVAVLFALAIIKNKRMEKRNEK